MLATLTLYGLLAFLYSAFASGCEFNFYCN